MQQEVQNLLKTVIHKKKKESQNPVHQQHYLERIRALLSRDLVQTTAPEGNGSSNPLMWDSLECAMKPAEVEVKLRSNICVKKSHKMANQNFHTSTCEITLTTPKVFSLKSSNEGDAKKHEMWPHL